MAQELFQLRDELGDGAPLSNILSFEAKEFFSVLLHDTLLNEKLWVVGEDLRPACTSCTSVDALHVVEGIGLSLLVNNILFHGAIHGNLVALSLGIQVLPSSSWRVAGASGPSLPRVARLPGIEAPQSGFILSLVARSRPALPGCPEDLVVLHVHRCQEHAVPVQACVWHHVRIW